MAETCEVYVVDAYYAILQNMPSRVYKADAKQCQISIVNVS
jgi:hypothetical protein